MDLFFSAVLLLDVFICSSAVDASPIKPRLDNGLALTPPMGWNSYNAYSCSPNEEIMRSNADALVDLGLAELGYRYVTTDCGWTVPDRLPNGELTWNEERFPSGFPELGRYLHDRDLLFGAYSDAGIKMCMTGEPDQAGSLGAFVWVLRCLKRDGEMSVLIKIQITRVSTQIPLLAGK